MLLWGKVNKAILALVDYETTSEYVPYSVGTERVTSISTKNYPEDI